MRSQAQILAQIKASQYRSEIARHGRQCKARPATPLDFPHWVQGGVNRMKEAGARVCPVFPEENNGQKAICFDWGDHMLVRSVDDLFQEYETEYLPQFKNYF